MNIRLSLYFDLPQRIHEEAMRMKKQGIALKVRGLYPLRGVLETFEGAASLKKEMYGVNGNAKMRDMIEVELPGNLEVIKRLELLLPEETYLLMGEKGQYAGEGK